MSKHWNDELMVLEAKVVEDGPVMWPTPDSLTDCQFVGMERWDMQWEIERLQKIVANKDKEIGSLRFDVAILKAELNAVRGRKV